MTPADLQFRHPMPNNYARLVPYCVSPDRQSFSKQNERQPLILQTELWKRRQDAASENAQERFPLCPQLRRREV